MALTLAAKAPTAVYRYTWAVPVADGDSVASYTLTESGCTIDADSRDGNSITMFISGGTAGATATIAALALTNDGEDIPETIYLPIRDTANTLVNTGRDVVDYALRKVNGGEPSDAEQLADGLERLSDMLAAWAMIGADLGILWPVGENDVIRADDGTLSAIKNNLILALADRYEFTPSPFVVQAANNGMKLVRNSRVPQERAGAEYY